MYRIDGGISHFANVRNGSKPDPRLIPVWVESGHWQSERHEARSCRMAIANRSDGV